MIEQEIIDKFRFLRVGYPPPKTSKLKTDKITNDTLFGTGAQSTFNYNTRYCKEEEDKDYNYDTLFSYESRYSKENNYTITKNGPLDTKEKMEAFRKMGYETLSNVGNVMYETIVSFKDLNIADKYKMLGSKGFGEVVEKFIDPWLKKYGFDPNNVEWFIDFHPDNRTSQEPHPHMHMCFFEKEQTRTFAKLPKESLNDFKQRFATRLTYRCSESKQIMHNLLKRSDCDRDLLKTSLKKCKLENVQSVIDLWNVLPNSGRLQYDSTAMINYRPAIDKVVDNLLNSKEFKKDYDSYISKLDEYDNMVNRISGNKTDIAGSFKKTTEDKKLRKEIANYILQQKKSYDEEKDYKNFTTSKTGKKLAPHQISRKLNTRKNGKTNAEHRVHRFINGAVAARQREIEEEIEKFLRASQPDYDDEKQYY